MEFQLTPKVTIGKPEEASRAKAIDRAKASAYNKLDPKPETDMLNLSPQAKLMQNLRTSYNKLSETETSISEIKQKVAEQGLHDLSAEEIVAGILHGTLFEAI